MASFIAVHIAIMMGFLFKYLTRISPAQGIFNILDTNLMYKYNFNSSSPSQHIYVAGHCDGFSYGLDSQTVHSTSQCWRYPDYSHLDNCQPYNCRLGQLTPGQLPPGQLPPGQLPPRTTSTQDNCHPDNCQPRGVVGRKHSHTFFILSFVVQWKW